MFFVIQHNFELGEFFYSYRRALIGSRLAAFFAGYHPKKIPVAAHTTNDKIIDDVLTMNGQDKTHDTT